MAKKQVMRKLVVDHYGTTCIVLNDKGAKIALISKKTRDFERSQYPKKKG